MMSILLEDKRVSDKNDPICKLRRLVLYTSASCLIKLFNSLIVIFVLHDMGRFKSPVFKNIIINGSMTCHFKNKQ